jgi:hypothetical protein
MDRFVPKEGKIQCFVEEDTPPKKKSTKLCEEDAIEGFYESVISSPN